MTIYISLLVCIIGALVYALSANPKLSEMGRISLFSGLFVFLLQLAPRAVSTLGR